ncbi:MAG: hypothetical protein DHS20C15_32490 [Planctomycetota bacterium]|nr:MAG: hypothetical protein DHS20C15_32490 [Planctomycetota bacterium]
MSAGEKARPDRPTLPVAPPAKQKPARKDAGDAPDLHIEEVEERHIPKDRNIFDK